MSNNITYESSVADIVYSIADGNLNKAELEELLLELQQHNKLGEKKVVRTSKEQWNQAYLNELKNDFLCSSISREYLLYLYEVSEYIRKEKKKASLGKIICIASATLVIAAVVIGIIYVVCGRSAKGAAQSKISLDACFNTPVYERRERT